jgi:metal-sulfur cluster biosynthetic enzyme
LVYNIEIKPEQIYILLTMSSPACPLHGVIPGNMDKVLRQTFPDLGLLTIKLVWDLPRSPEMMSGTAQKQLG